MMVRLHGSIGPIVLGALAGSAYGQDPPGEPAPPAQPLEGLESKDPTTGAAAEAEWSFGFSMYTYFTPDREYLLPTFTADRDWLHLEARYNYEAFDAASLWVGYNLAFGEDFTVALTPMLGVVFGDKEGYAPGYEATLGWRMFELYSEGEYLFDTDDHAESFFYNWSELTVSPVESFRFGLVAQRGYVRGGDSDLQYGPLIGFATQRFDFTAFVLDLDTDDPTYVFSAAITF